MIIIYRELRDKLEACFIFGMAVLMPIHRASEVISIDPHFRRLVIYTGVCLTIFSKLRSSVDDKAIDKWYFIRQEDKFAGWLMPLKLTPSIG